MTALNVSASSHASASPTDSTVVPESTGGGRFSVNFGILQWIG